MTICIAAYGNRAGKAVLHTLAAVESVASGAIGGFVSAVALDGDQCFRAETQVGGVSQIDHDQSGVLFENAPVAGLISSGPNRPAPLSAFLPAIPGVGLVTGHRSPSVTNESGEPLNLLVLRNLQFGMNAGDAINAVVNAYPEADAGFTAMTCSGDAYSGNTPEVLQRPDIGFASFVRKNASVLVMHNSIRPMQHLANLATHIAMETLSPAHAEVKTAWLRKGCEIVEGSANAIHVDNEFRVMRIAVSQSLDEHQNGNMIVLNLGYQPPVYSEYRQIGVLIDVPYLLTSKGRLYSANGQSFLELSVGSTLNVVD